MRIDLTAPNGELVVVAVNGAVAAEVCVGQVRTGDDLMLEVEQARAAVATVQRIIPRLCEAAGECERLPGGLAPGKAGDAWARGLRDGLAGLRMPHPHGGVPSVQRENSDPYRDGYGRGDTLRRVAGLVTADAPADLFSGQAVCARCFDPGHHVSDCDEAAHEP